LLFFGHATLGDWKARLIKKWHMDKVIVQLPMGKSLRNISAIISVFLLTAKFVS